MTEISSREALLKGKCPVCREGDIFKYPLTRIAHFAEMNQTCKTCGALLEPEPGFYFGAMYITYAFNVVLLVGFGLALLYFVTLPEVVYLVLIALMAAVITPFGFRWSRILWLYWFGGLQYKPKGER